VNAMRFTVLTDRISLDRPSRQLVRRSITQSVNSKNYTATGGPARPSIEIQTQRPGVIVKLADTVSDRGTDHLVFKDKNVRFNRRQSAAWRSEKAK